jgi:cytochrome c553
MRMFLRACSTAGGAAVLAALMSVHGAAFAQGAPKGNAAAAKEKNASCIGCHGIPGYQVVFPETYRVPMIYGQSERYIYNALQAYKKGERTHATMRAITASMSDQDMADLAAYYSGAHTAQAAAASK